jgi:hypothetical protein
LSLHGYDWSSPFIPTQSIHHFEEFIMNKNSAIPLPNHFNNQPAQWPLLFLIPVTRYVKRQRASNSPQYHRPEKAVTHHTGPTGNNHPLFQRITGTITTARNRAWISLKRAGRWFTRLLVKWLLLPLAIAACVSMIDASPAELPVDYYGIEVAVQMEHQ